MSTSWIGAVNNAESTLDGDMTGTALTFSVATGDGTEFDPISPAAYPVDMWIGEELVRVASRNVDEFTISALTDRGLEGTSRVAHSDGEVVAVNVNAGHVTQLQTRLRTAELFLRAVCGGDTDGVQPCDGLDNLAVVAAAVPDMTVIMGTGAAYVDGYPVYNAADDTSAVMVAPTVNPRIDTIQVDSEGNLEIVTGVEGAVPVAPAASADAMKLAEVYHRVGTIHIDNADDTANSYITDARTWL
jgi:hypothetical protein